MYDLMKIKKYYGENMMQLCRELFPTLLEQKGLLLNLLESKFAHSKFLYEDIIKTNSIEKFKDFIYSIGKTKQELPVVPKTPKELLAEAGYTLYECHNEDDIQRFIVYYDYDEELCTFNGGRLEECYVFFAVKKNVDEINRWDFDTPKREDEYGTSVISIQFTRGETNTLSIKNRYNHTVNNPDATFSNNLENIVPGLTRSFEKEYNLKIAQYEDIDFELPGYIKATNGKYYKYNYEINGIYYCPDNIVIYFGDVDDYFNEKEKYLIIDYFVIDLVKKRIYTYDNLIIDSFIDGLQNIKNISITRTKKGKIIEITLEDDKKAYIEVNKYNQIIGYKNENIRKVRNDFLSKNKTLQEVELVNVEVIGEKFLMRNEDLTKILLPKVTIIGNKFLSYNTKLTSIELPYVEEIGSDFLIRNEELSSIEIPKAKKLHTSFLSNNKKLVTLNLPNVEEIFPEFLHFNECLETLNIPKVRLIGNSSLSSNKKIKRLILPCVEVIYDNVLSSNQELEYISMPKIKNIGYDFLSNNPKMISKIYQELSKTKTR